MAPPRAAHTCQTETLTTHKPPAIFTACRWLLFSATVAIAIGQLALLDQHLLGFPWVYDGPLLQYQGRQITISYCLLSPSLDYSVDANCNFALTASAVSLGLSLLWSYIQVLRRNPSKHHNSKLLDLAICCVGVAWWAAAGIAFCIWTDRANKSGMMQPSWRNGLCALAWAQFLMFTGLTLTSLLLVTLKSQKWFDKYAEKQQHKKEEQKAAKQAAKLRKKQEKEAATVAAKPAAAPAPEPGALLPAQVPAAAQQGLPVSSAATHAAGAAPDAAGNPFITEGPDRV